MEEKEHYENQISFPIKHFLILYFNMTVEYVHISPETCNRWLQSNKTHGFKISHCLTKPQQASCQSNTPSSACTIFFPCMCRLYFIVKAVNWWWWEQTFAVHLQSQTEIRCWKNIYHSHWTLKLNGTWKSEKEMPASWRE